MRRCRHNPRLAASASPRGVARGLMLGLTLGLAACGPGLETVSVVEPVLAPSRTTVVGTPGAPLRLHSEEEGTGPPLLLIHGFGASSYSWRAVRSELARTNHVIAIDLKGFGRSDKPLDEDYSALDQAKVLVQFLDQRGLKEISVAGHSFGGGVALSLAIELNRRYPGRLQKLILVDGVAYEQGLPPAFHVLRTPIVGPASAAIVPPVVQSTAALMLAYKDSSKITQEAIDAYARPMREAGNRHALVHTAQKIVPEYVNIVTYQYRMIAQPVLLIWCRDDKIVPLAVGQRLVREMPNARLEVIETCGHVPQEEEPALTSGFMQNFLSVR
jgi:pimeloyl-ACP methyl ester carboxylesterase